MGGGSPTKQNSSLQSSIVFSEATYEVLSSVMRKKQQRQEESLAANDSRQLQLQSIQEVKPPAITKYSKVKMLEDELKKDRRSGKAHDEKDEHGSVQAAHDGDENHRRKTSPTKGKQDKTKRKPHAEGQGDDRPETPDRGDDRDDPKGEAFRSKASRSPVMRRIMALGENATQPQHISPSSARKWTTSNTATHSSPLRQAVHANAHPIAVVVEEPDAHTRDKLPMIRVSPDVVINKPKMSMDLGAGNKEGEGLGNGRLNSISRSPSNIQLPAIAAGSPVIKGPSIVLSETGKTPVMNSTENHAAAKSRRPSVMGSMDVSPHAHSNSHATTTQKPHHQSTLTPRVQMYFKAKHEESRNKYGISIPGFVMDAVDVLTNRDSNLSTNRPDVRRAIQIYTMRLQDINPSIRMESIKGLQVLELLSQDWVNTPLFTALTDTHAGVRREAAKALSMKGFHERNPQIIDELLHQLEDCRRRTINGGVTEEEAMTIEIDIIRFLGDLGECEVKIVQALTRRLEEHIHPLIRAEAERSLVNMNVRDATVFSAVFARVTDKNWRLRLDSVRALTLLELEDDQLASCLVHRLGEEWSNEVREEIVSAVCSLNLIEDVVTGLVELCTSIDCIVRVRAIEAIDSILAQSESDDVGGSIREGMMKLLHLFAPMIVNTLDDISGMVRLQASLASHRLKPWMMMIKEFIAKKDELPDVEEINASLVGSGVWAKTEKELLMEGKKVYEDVMHGLRSRLKDPHPEIRTAAASALGHFGIKTDDIVSALTQLIHDADSEVVSTAERALFQLGVKEKDVVQVIERQQQLENEDIVLEVPIHSVKDKSVFQALTLLAGSCLLYRLDDVSSEIRDMSSRALRALGLRGPSLATTLMRHMRDPKLNTIITNVIAFHLVEEDMILQTFAMLARDRHQDLRAGCAFLLGTCPRLWAVADGLGYGEVISILLGLLEDEHEEVKKDALLALVNIAQKEDLASLIDGPDPDADFYAEMQEPGFQGDNASFKDYPSPSLDGQEPAGYGSLMRGNNADAMSDIDASSNMLSVLPPGALKSSAGNIRRIISAIQRMLIPDDFNTEEHAKSDVHYTAAISLAMLEIDDELVINALVGHLANDEKRSRRAEILEALRRIGKKRSSQGHIHQGCNCNVMITALKKSLAGTKRDLFVAACRALLAFDVKEEEIALNILDVVSKASNAWDMRVECCTMLGQLGFAHEKVIEFLLAVITDADPLMRAAAIKSFNTIYLIPRMVPITPDERVLTSILTRLTDMSDRVRSAATKTCTSLNITERCVSELLRGVKDPRASVRCAAVRTMGLLGGVRVANSVAVEGEEGADLNESPSPDKNGPGASSSPTFRLSSRRKKKRGLSVRQLGPSGVSRFCDCDPRIPPVLTDCLLDADASVAKAAADSIRLLQADKVAISILSQRMFGDDGAGGAKKGQMQVSVASSGDVGQEKDGRLEALKALAVLGVKSKEVVQLLVRGLFDERVDVKSQCVSMLDSINAKDDFVVEALIKVFEEDLRIAQIKKATAGKIKIRAKETDTYNLRSIIIKAFIHLKFTHPKVVEVLLAHLQDDDGTKRVEAIQALASLEQQGETVAQALEQCLHDEDMHVRAEAVRSIGDCISEKTIPKIVATLLQEKQSIVRLEISKLISKFLLDGYEVITALLSWIDDRSSQTRLEVVRCLGNLAPADEDGRVTTALVKRMENDEIPAVRAAAAETIGNMSSSFTAKDKSVANALILLLSDTQHFVRVQALNAIGLLKFNSKAVVDAVIQRLLDWHDEVVMEAAKLLSKLGVKDERVANSLLLKLEDGSVTARTIAAKALALLGLSSRNIVHGLQLRLENDPSAAVRCESAVALQRLGVQSEVIVTTLIEFLYERNPEIRSAAVKALAMLGDAAQNLNAGDDAEDSKKSSRA
eukprot:TRINITY_DN4210_c1_g1_i1.p1 TRINITY_DN4210_c1_g1~~TRINITY_DN4210_c1_g1_i1.p1  ORF type:complete len:2033 (-),score=431.34 TRINITY_DN4210_c1_g1_i1:113-5842(-)